MPSHLHIFKKYLNPWFIETGTYKSEGLALAIQAGFKHIQSVEIKEEYWQEALQKFHNYPEIFKLYLGATEDHLAEMIQNWDQYNSQEGLTIWLDAHFCLGPGNFGQGKQFCPLLDELEIIRKACLDIPSKNYPIILIDDIRCCGKEEYGFPSKYELEAKVRSINSNYKIAYEDSYERNDILCASVS